MTTQQKSLIIGAIIGAAMGALGGYLFTRGLEIPRDRSEPEGFSLRALPPGDMVKLVIAVLGVLRGVAELGERV